MFKFEVVRNFETTIEAPANAPSSDLDGQDPLTGASFQNSNLAKKIGTSENLGWGNASTTQHRVNENKIESTIYTDIVAEFVGRRSCRLTAHNSFYGQDPVTLKGLLRGKYWTPYPLFGIK